MFNDFLVGDRHLWYFLLWSLPPIFWVYSSILRTCPYVLFWGFKLWTVHLYFMLVFNNKLVDIILFQSIRFISLMMRFLFKHLWGPYAWTDLLLFFIKIVLFVILRWSFPLDLLNINKIILISSVLENVAATFLSW